MFDLPFTSANGDITSDLADPSTTTNVEKFVTSPNTNTTESVGNESINHSSISSENVEGNASQNSYETVAIATALASSPIQHTTYSINNGNSEKSKGMVAPIPIEPLTTTNGYMNLSLIINGNAYVDLNTTQQGNNICETNGDMGDNSADRASISRKASTGSEYTSLSPDYSPENTITPNSDAAVLDRSFDKYIEMTNQAKTVAVMDVTPDTVNLDDQNGNSTPTVIETPSNFNEFGKRNYHHNTSLLEDFTFSVIYILTALYI